MTGINQYQINEFNNYRAAERRTTRLFRIAQVIVLAAVAAWVVLA